MRALYLFLFLCSIQLVFGQSKHFEQELGEAIETTPKLDLRLDSRHSFINQAGVRVFGVKAGIQFAEKLSFGLGFNQLWSDLEREVVRHGNSYKVALSYYNISPYVEYVFYQDPKWELSIPVQFGFGESYYRNISGSGQANFDRKFVSSYEPAITFQYRFFKYFGAGMGVGYRLMLVPNSNLEEQFTSPVYIFKFKVYFEDLYEDYAP